MIKNLEISIKKFLLFGHERTVRVKKNIVASLFVKAGVVIIGLMLVPLTIKYINPQQYGIWLTLSSIVGWFSFFDIGLGNGLRNKLAKAIAEQDFLLARKYVSTTYAILSIIVFILLLLFGFTNSSINWPLLLNAPKNMAKDLNILAFLVFISFSFQLVLQLINTIMIANQQPSKAATINFLGNLVSLIIIFILTKTTSGNLIYLGTAICATPCIVYILYSYLSFKTTYKIFAPSLSLIRLSFAKDLLNIGSAFFIIQIGAIVLFQTDNVIIAQLFGPRYVTTFNITYRLFSVAIMGFTIIMTPLWSAFTEAYAKNDIDWIRTIFKQTKRYWLYLVAFSILLFVFSPTIFRIWLKDSIQVPMLLSFSMSIYVIGNGWLMIHCFLLNGLSKIRLQLYLYVLTIFLNLPCAYVFGTLFGLVGVVLSNILIYLIMGFIFSIQCKRILNCTAKGIWNK